MITGMPQMQSDLGLALAAPITLTLTGAGGGSWTIAPAGNEITVSEGASSTCVADVSSNGHSFVNWGTKRSHWSEHCKVTGDQAVAAKFLDALNII